MGYRSTGRLAVRRDRSRLFWRLLRSAQQGDHARFPRFGNCRAPRFRCAHILKAYGRDAFEIGDSYVRIVFRFKTVSSGESSPKTSEKTDGAIGGAIGGAVGLTDRQNQIVQLIARDSKMTYRQIAQVLKINDSAVIKHIKALREKGVLRRVGGTRGHWEVLDTDNDQPSTNN